MKEKVIRFMQGRYGADSFTKFIMMAAIASTVLSLFIGKHFFYALAIGLLLYSYFRIFSKNFNQRYKENQCYLKYANRLTGLWSRTKVKIVQRKHYHIYKCPKCQQKIRIPRGKGKIAITCPKCREEFQKRSW